MLDGNVNLCWRNFTFNS